MVLLCIIFSSSAFADKLIRIVNNDATQDLNVQLQSCLMAFNESTKTYDVTCKDVPSVPIKNYGLGKHYVDISIPNDAEHAETFLHVASVQASPSGAYSSFQDDRSLSHKYCSSFDRHQPIVLNTLRTDNVFCDTSIDGIDKNNIKKINKK